MERFPHSTRRATLPSNGFKPAPEVFVTRHTNFPSSSACERHFQPCGNSRLARLDSSRILSLPTTAPVSRTNPFSAAIIAAIILSTRLSREKTCRYSSRSGRPYLCISLRNSPRLSPTLHTNAWSRPVAVQCADGSGCADHERQTMMPHGPRHAASRVQSVERLKPKP